MKLNKYVEAVRKAISEYAGHKPSKEEIETEVVINQKRGHYEVIYVG